MTKEQYVKTLITRSGHTVKSFAASIGLPYSTLLGLLTRGLDGASVHNVFRVCKALDITVEDLERGDDDDNPPPMPFYVNEREKRVITLYRDNAKMRPAVDKLLGVDEGEK